MKLIKFQSNILVLLFFAFSTLADSSILDENNPKNIEEAMKILNSKITAKAKIKILQRGFSQKSFLDFRYSIPYQCIDKSVLSKWGNDLPESIKGYVPQDEVKDFLLFIFWYEGRTSKILNKSISEIYNLYKKSLSSTPTNFVTATVTDVGENDIEKQCNDMWASSFEESAEYVYPFLQSENLRKKESLVVVMDGFNYGLINAKLELIAPFKYNNIWIVEEHEIAVLSVGYGRQSKFALANKNKILIDNLDDIDFDGRNILNKSPNRRSDGHGYYFIKNDTLNKWGSFHIKVKRNNIWELFKVSKGEIIKNEFKNISKVSPKDSLYLVSNSPMMGSDGTRCGYVNKNGKEVIPIKYSKGSEFYNGYAVVDLEINSDGMKGVIDTRGNVVIPCKFRMVEANKGSLYNNKHLFIVSTKGKYSIINLTGANILGQEFEEIGYWFEDNLKKDFFQICNGNKCGIANSDGKVIIPIIYDGIDMVDGFFQLNILEKIEGKDRLKKDKIKIE